MNPKVFRPAVQRLRNGKAHVPNAHYQYLHINRRNQRITIIRLGYKGLYSFKPRSVPAPPYSLPLQKPPKNQPVNAA